MSEPPMSEADCDRMERAAIAIEAMTEECNRVAAENTRLAAELASEREAGLRCFEDKVKLEADRDQISLTLAVAKADRDKWFNRARDLEAELARAKAANIYDAGAHKRVSELEAALLKIDLLGFGPCSMIVRGVMAAAETGAKPANETLARSALGNLLAAVIKFGPIDADIELAMREARQIMGFPFTSDRGAAK